MQYLHYQNYLFKPDPFRFEAFDLLLYLFQQEVQLVDGGAMLLHIVRTSLVFFQQCYQFLASFRIVEEI